MADWPLGSVALAAVVLAAAPVGAHAEGALQCPPAHPSGGLGVIQESRARIQRLGAVLGSDAEADHLPSVVADLRRRHPHVANAEIYNYLLAAYCPDVRRLSGLTNAERQARIAKFRQQVETVFAAGY